MINIIEDKQKDCVYVTFETVQERLVIEGSAETYRWDQAHKRYVCQKREVIPIVNAAKAASGLIPLEIKFPEEIYNYQKACEDEFRNKLAYLKSIRQSGLSIADVDYFNNDFHGKFAPMDHQVVMFEYHTTLDYSANFSDMGTGKTAAMLWAADARMQKEQVKKCLCVVPTSIMWNWAREVSIHTPHRKAIICHEPSKAKRLKKFDIVSDFYITNYETLRMLSEEEREEFKFMFNEDDMVIFDEVHKLKDPSTQQSKAAIKIFQTGVGYKIIATGTPIGNNLLDIHQPVILLDKNIGLDPSFHTFRQRYFKQEGFKWYPMAGTKAMVQERIFRRAVRYKKSECLTLPEKVYITKTCKLSEKQQDLYRALQNDLVAEINEGNITAKNILSQIVKLSEITSGWVRNDEGQDFILQDSAKMKLLEEVLEEIDQEDPDTKVIIWAKFIKDIENIEKLIGKDKCVTLYGENSDNVRETCDKFDKDPKIKFFIANPKVGGVGLNLTVASHAIYYSHSYSFLERSQSEDRNHRKGSEIHDSIIIIDLVCQDTVDEVIVDAVRDKKDLSESIIDTFKNKVTDILNKDTGKVLDAQQKFADKERKAIDRISDSRQEVRDIEEEWFKKHEVVNTGSGSFVIKRDGLTEKSKNQASIDSEDSKTSRPKIKKEVTLFIPPKSNPNECPICLSSDITQTDNKSKCRLCLTEF